MSCECLYIFGKLCPHFQPMYDTLSEERIRYELIKASRKRAEGPVTWTVVLSWTSSTSPLKLALTCHWFNVHTWYLFCTCLMPYSCCTVSLMTDSFFKLSFVSKVFRIKQKLFMWSLNPSSAFLSVLAFTCFNDCGNDKLVAKHQTQTIFPSCHCTHVYVVSRALGHKVAQCSLNSNKIAVALFLWHYLWLWKILLLGLNRHATP